MSEMISIFDLLPEDDEMAKRFKPIKSTDWKWTMADDYPKEKNGLKVFSCFACGGGSTMGYKLAGCDVIGCCEIDKDISNAINRLCELEDKIEQGKIVELPCAVGSEAYHLTSADTLDERIKQAKKKRNEAYQKDSVQGIVYWDGYLDALKAVKEDKENEQR